MQAQQLSNGEKINRSRLTKLKVDTFMLGMVDNRGRWELTPYKGNVKELVSMLILYTS
jgi:hypothetical protein